MLKEKLIFAAIFAVVTYFEIKWIWRLISSLRGKPFFVPPSKRKWAEITPMREDEDVLEYPASVDELSVKHNGIPSQGIKSPKYEIVTEISYEFEGEVYKTNIRKKLPLNGKIYCNRKAPKWVKVLDEQGSLPVSAAVSGLFILALFIFFEIVFISQIIN